MCINVLLRLLEVGTLGGALVLTTLNNCQAMEPQDSKPKTSYNINSNQISANEYLKSAKQTCNDIRYKVIEFKKLDEPTCNYDSVLLAKQTVQNLFDSVRKDQDGQIFTEDAIKIQINTCYLQPLQNVLYRIRKQALLVEEMINLGETYQGNLIAYRNSKFAK